MTCTVALVAVLAVHGTALAQDSDRPTRSPLRQAVQDTLLDPTTFAPSILAYQFTMRDWDTSQTFFAHGFVEHNSRFTATGLPDDTPLAYDAGRRQILRDALVGVEVSAVQNVTTRLVERSLIERYPEHARLIKTAGWIERISFASIMAYKLSAPHYRQWQLNQQLAFQYGF